MWHEKNTQLMHHTDKYSHGRTVWLNDWEFACKLRGCEFGSSCNHLSLSEFFWQERSN